MQGQNEDGTLKPPTGTEATEVKAEGLANAQPQQQEIKMLTMDEADFRRANFAFNKPYKYSEEDLHKVIAFKEMAFNFSALIIDTCPSGKERSQALGQVHAAVLWAVAAIESQQQAV